MFYKRTTNIELAKVFYFKSFISRPLLGMDSTMETKKESSEFGNGIKSEPHFSMAVSLKLEDPYIFKISI